MDYLGEEGYRSHMQCTVEPYIKKYRRKGYFESYDGTSIFYYTYRKPEAKKCVVISHGFCEFAEKYNEMIYYFLLAGYSVYLPEHRGHGYSDRKTADIEKVHVEDFEDYVRDFHCFMKKIVREQEKDRILFGHSMGGAVAVRYLEQHPDIFQGAVLSSPMLRMQTGKYPEWLAKWVADYFTMTGRGMEYAAGQKGFDAKPDFSGSSCVSEERYRYVFEKRMKDLQYRTYGASYAWLRTAIKATAVLRKKENLEKITIPVLLFVAGRDHMVDNRAAAEFVNGVRKVSLKYMENSKHEIFNADYETRAAYYEQIFDFLVNVTASERNERNDEEEITETGKILGTV